MQVVRRRKPPPAKKLVDALRKEEPKTKPAQKQDKATAGEKHNPSRARSSTGDGKRSQHRGRLPDAIIIRKKEGAPNYAELLKNLKGDPQLKEVSQRISRVGRTLAGDLILVLGSKEGSSTVECGQALKTACEGTADVTVKVPEEEVELRGIDEFTSDVELREAVGAILKDETDLDSLRLRKGVSGDPDCPTEVADQSS